MVLVLHARLRGVILYIIPFCFCYLVSFLPVGGKSITLVVECLVLTKGSEVMKSKLVYWSMQVGIFLLRSAGWAATGIVIGFVVSFFFRPVGRVDTFAFTETMLGVVITGLSIVGAFIIALQWSNLDKRMHEFDVKVEDTSEFFEIQAATLRQMARDTESTVNAYTRRYEENMEQFDGLLKEYVRVAHEISDNIDTHRALYEEKTKEAEERQKEFSKITAESRVLIEKVENAFALQEDRERTRIAEAARNTAGQ